MDKQELFDKAVEIALSRKLIKDSGDVDPDKSGEVVGFYRLVAADKKVLARINMNDIKGWWKMKLGCWFVLGVPVFIVALPMIWAIFIPSIISTLCAEAGPGEVVEYLDSEYTCPEK